MPEDVCILIHGFTGNPEEVMPLASALERRGFDIATPLLPGHKHGKARMDRARAIDWIDTVDEIIKQKAKEYQNMHLIGFSMGAMIATLMAKRYLPSSLILLSPAVFVVTPKVIAHRTKHALKLMKENRRLFLQAACENVVNMRSAPIYNVIQFKKVVYQAKKVIPTVDTPVCIMHGLEDEIADPISSDWVYRTISSAEKELYTLPASRHLICHGTEADELIETVTRFIESHSTCRAGQVGQGT